jgi:thiamine biosynthesis lipoprotein
LPDQHGKARTLTAVDVAYATSGGNEQNGVIGGTTVTHLVDPRTGRPMSDATGAVTVTADRCILADAWATAFSVVTRAEARQLAQKAGIGLMDWRN